MGRSEPERAEVGLGVKFADIVHDTDGHSWVCIGWVRNSAGIFPTFTREQKPKMPYAPDYTYYAAYTETLIKKFPDLERLRLRKGHR